MADDIMIFIEKFISFKAADFLECIIETGDDTFEAGS